MSISLSFCCTGVRRNNVSECPFQGVLYRYRFDAGDAKSPLGQFRLPPAPSQPQHRLDYAIFSCANRHENLATAVATFYVHDSLSVCFAAQSDNLCKDTDISRHLKLQPIHLYSFHAFQCISYDTTSSCAGVLETSGPTPKLLIGVPKVETNPNRNIGTPNLLMFFTCFHCSLVRNSSLSPWSISCCKVLFKFWSCLGGSGQA